jgi:hypothetical protein
MTPIAFSGTLTRQDVARAMRVPGVVFLGAMFVVFGSISTVAAAMGHEPWHGAVLLLVGVLLLLAPRLGSARLMRTSVTISAPRKGIADESHIEFETEYGHSSLPWPVFYRVRLARDYVALYQSAGAFYLMPRRFFAAESEWEAFRALVATHVRVRRRGRAMLVTAAVWLVVVIVTYALWSVLRAPQP